MKVKMRRKRKSQRKKGRTRTSKLMSKRLKGKMRVRMLAHPEKMTRRHLYRLNEVEDDQEDGRKAVVLELDVLEVVAEGVPEGKDG